VKLQFDPLRPFHRSRWICPSALRRTGSSTGRAWLCVQQIRPGVTPTCGALRFMPLFYVPAARPMRGTGVMSG